jgi:hypothetical protein
VPDAGGDVLRQPIDAAIPYRQIRPADHVLAYTPDFPRCRHVAIRSAIAISKMVDAPATPHAPLGRVTAPDLRMTILNCAVRSASRLPIRLWHLTCPFSWTADNDESASQTNTRLAAKGSHDYEGERHGLHSLSVAGLRHHLEQLTMDFILYLLQVCGIIWSS